MQIIEDELSKIFESEEIKRHIKVKKVITNEGVKIVPLKEGDLENAIPIVVEIEDLRYNPNIINYIYDTGIIYTTGYTTIIDDTEYSVP